MRPFVARLRTAIRSTILGWNTVYLRAVWKMNIGYGTRIAFSAKMDKTNPTGVNIGNYTGISFGAVILAHDFLLNLHKDTWIGDNCQIGARAIICPGVRIGNGCVIAVGSVVTSNVPDGCLVMGNPARIVERDIKPGKFGIRVDVIPPERLDARVLAE
jgi:acetyltransferase-like isoleucine patch superfamily enzyme